MLKKILTTTLITCTFLNAAYEKIKIGKIDSYYDDKVSYEELRIIIDEIEQNFETTLNRNIFDYSQSGKPIDILYVPASKLERRIKAKLDRVNNKQRKINKTQESFYELQEQIDILKSEVSYENTVLNEKVNTFNEYVKKINKMKQLTQEQYNAIKKEVASKKSKLDKEIRAFKSKQRKLKRRVSSFNNKVHSYNNQIRELNRLNNEVESMSRSFKKIKGKAFGTREVTLKTYYKNGKKIKERSVKNSMSKIEIYGFNSHEELKAVLAHEIAHMVGIPHIEDRDALMNPILQENQLRKLELTYDDIINFNENF